MNFETFFSLDQPLSSVVAVCWGTFLVVWVVGAIYNMRNAPPVQKGGTSLIWWIVGIVLVGIVMPRLPREIWSSVTVDSPLLQAIGVVLLIASTGWTLWARGVLGRMWSSMAVVKVQHELRTTGPYAVTRHPIYTGLLGMALGTALISGLGPWLYGIAVIIIILELKIRAEERLLTESFGDRYREYRRHVPQIIPGLRLPGASRGSASSLR